MEVGPGTGGKPAAGKDVDLALDPFAPDPELRAELFNWATAIGSYHEEALGMQEASSSAADAASASTDTVIAWRPGTDMPLALRRLNRFLLENRSDPNAYARLCLGEWAVAQERLLPYLRRFWDMGGRDETATLHATLRMLIMLSEEPPAKCPPAVLLRLNRTRRELRDSILASTESWAAKSDSAYEEELSGEPHPAVFDTMPGAGIAAEDDSDADDDDYVEGGNADEDEEEAYLRKERRRREREAAAADATRFSRQERFHARARMRPSLTGLQVLMRLCRAALASSGAARTQGQTRVLEFVLYLLQNLASVPAAPEAGAGAAGALGSTGVLCAAVAGTAPGTTSAQMAAAARASDVAFVLALEEESVLTVVTGLCCLLDASENGGLAKYLLRLLSALVGQADATQLVRAGRLVRDAQAEADAKHAEADALRRSAEATRRERKATKQHQAVAAAAAAAADGDDDDEEEDDDDDDLIIIGDASTGSGSSIQASAPASAPAVVNADDAISKLLSTSSSSHGRHRERTTRTIAATADIDAASDPLLALRAAGCLGRGGVGASASRHGHFGAAFVASRVAALTEAGRQAHVGQRAVYSDAAGGPGAKRRAGVRLKPGRKGGKTARMTGVTGDAPLMEAASEMAGRLAAESRSANRPHTRALAALWRAGRRLVGAEQEGPGGSPLLAKGLTVLMRHVKRELVRGGEDLGARAGADFLGLVRFSLSFRLEDHRAAAGAVAASNEAALERYRAARKAIEAQLTGDDALDAALHVHDKVAAQLSALARPVEAAPPAFTGRGVGVILDFFTFTQVVQAGEQALTERDLDGAATAAAALKEMLSALSALRSSSDKDARGLGASVTNLVFYERDIIDVVPRMLRQWQPGRFSRGHLFSLIEAGHVALKVAKDLADNGAKVLTRKRGSSRRSSTGGGRDGDGDGGDEEEDELEVEKRAKKQSHRSEVFLDFHRVLSEYLYKNTMRAYAQAVTTWRYNGARRNHFVATFLRRVMTAPVPGALPPADGSGEPWPFTWAPMLWHVEFLVPLADSLNNPASWRHGITPPEARKRSIGAHHRIRATPHSEYALLIDVAQSVTSQFLRCAHARPVLAADALLWRERGVNAEIACGYDTEGALLVHSGGTASRKQAELEAMAEARRNAEDAAAVDAEWSK